MLPVTMLDIAALAALARADWCPEPAAEREAVALAADFLQNLNRAIGGLHSCGLLLFHLEELATSSAMTVPEYRACLGAHCRRHSIHDLLAHCVQLHGQPVLLFNQDDPSNPELWTVTVPTRLPAVAPSWN